MSAELVNKPIFTTLKGAYVYGQVIAAQGSSVTFTTGSSTATVPASKAEEVAPIVCLLLQGANLKSRGHRIASMRNHHVNILDKLLGVGDEPGTRDISVLLDGVVNSTNQPRRTDVRTWMDLSTGKIAKFRLGHALDFAHFIDGNHEIPRRVNIGESFMDDPLFRSSNRVATMDAPTQRTDRSQLPSGPQPQNDSLGALLAELDEDEPAEAQTTATGGLAAKHELQAELVAALASKPRVLALYMEQCMGTSTSRKRAPEADIDAERPYRLQRLDNAVAPSDLLQLDESNDRNRSKTMFRPSNTQRAIFRTLASPTYSGKSPSLFMDLMLSSHATAFKPHPAILTRLFDFQFGTRGLSISHFERFDHQMQRRWRRETRVNMSNHSATVDLPAPPAVLSMASLQEALAVLHVFAVEFFNAPTVDLIATALQFCIWLGTLGQWQPDDLEEFVFWYDSILEDWRRHSEALAFGGNDTRHTVHARISRSDPDFLIMLFSLTNRRISTPAPGRSPPKPERTPRDQGQSNQRSGNNPDRRRTRVPPEVIAVLPRKNGISICLKYLSTSGCTEKVPNRCEFGRGHFSVDHLDPIVRRHIESHMGGLRADLVKA